MIIFDLGPLQDSLSAHSGLGRYFRNLIHSVTETGADVTLTYDPKRPLPAADGLTFNADLLPATRANLQAISASWFVTPLAFEKSFEESSRLFKACHPNGKIATVVRDLAPMIFEEFYLKLPVRRAHYNLCIESIRRSDLVLTVSERTKVDVEDRVRPDCGVVNIGTGVEDRFFQSNSDPEDVAWREVTRKVPSLTAGKFILTVSGEGEAKNLPALLEAYAACPIAFRMVNPLVVGGGLSVESRTRVYKEWDRILRTKRIEKSLIHVLPLLSDFEFCSVYRHACVFVLPSTYTGFGLPLAEALVSGTVCIASDASALPELLPRDEYTFSPRDTGRIARLLVRASGDAAYRAAFHDWAQGRTASLGWGGVGERLRHALPIAQTATDENRPTTRTAIIGPTAPAVTGIADYNASIGPCILEDQRFTFFSSNDALPIGSALQAYPASSLRNVWPQFTDCLYVIGNNSQHIGTLHDLRQRPGYVWLHDVGLRDLALGLARETTPHDPWLSVNAMMRAYPGTRSVVSDIAQFELTSYNFARPLLDAALGFIVHSKHAKKLLQQDLGVLEDRRPIHVVPHAIPSFETVRAQTARTDNAIVVGMVGFMGPNRLSHLTLDAAALIPRDGRSVTVRIVGACDDRLHAELRARSRSLGVDIEVTGYLEAQAFLAQIASVDVVVQLRQRSNGESSGTIANAIALSVPVITNVPSALEFWGPCLIPAPGIPNPDHIAKLIGLALQPGYRQTLADNLATIGPEFSYPAISKQIVAAMDELASHRTH